MNDTLRRFRQQVPPCDRWSIRIVQDDTETVSVRNDALEAVRRRQSKGAMVRVWSGMGVGYAATDDLSDVGLRQAGQRALQWAKQMNARPLFDASKAPLSSESGSWSSPVKLPYGDWPLVQKVDHLLELSSLLNTSDTIRMRTASLTKGTSEVWLGSSAGGEIHQLTQWLMPGLMAFASDGSDGVFRSLGRSLARQGGQERLLERDLAAEAVRVANEAQALLAAPMCPSGPTDVVLAADQMVLQIHESIGHPLELDRILGDERNMAGTSFVRPEMFGSFQYGTDKLNITYDPTLQTQVASFGWDDDGTKATREYLIRDGLLLRGIGGALSQHRSGVQGVSCSRASSWNRPTIDRMGNINLEAGDQSFDQLVGQVEDGIYMETNQSWSIDDSRNKFQMGTELGRIIKDGELRGLVKKPNYRGVSRSFWRSLKGVGRTREIGGTPFCGKGAPAQIIRVGHATPPCLFTGVDVFGGA